MTKEERQEYQRQWREKNPEYMRKYAAAKRVGAEFGVRENGKNRGHSYRDREAVLKARSARPKKEPPPRRLGGGVFTTEFASALLAFQGGRCAICPRELPESTDGETQLGRRAADHCEATRTPRGVLCWACNISLGWYEKQQRPAGLCIATYEVYLADPPFPRSGLTAPKPRKKHASKVCKGSP